MAKLSSTAQIMAGMYRDKNNIPASVPNSDPYLGRMVGIDLNMARTKAILQEKAVHTDMVQRIDSSLQYATAESYSEIMKSFPIDKSDSEHRMVERNKLLTEFKELSQEITERIAQVVQLIENKAPERDILLVIDHLSRRERGLAAPVDRLELNEEKLNRNLSNTYERIFKEAPLTARDKLLPPQQLPTFNRANP